MNDLEKAAFSVDDLTESESYYNKLNNGDKAIHDAKTNAVNINLNKGDISSLKEDSFLEDPDYIVKWDTARKESVPDGSSASNDGISPIMMHGQSNTEKPLKDDSKLRANNLK